MAIESALDAMNAALAGDTSLSELPKEQSVTPETENDDVSTPTDDGDKGGADDAEDGGGDAGTAGGDEQSGEEGSEGAGEPDKEPVINPRRPDGTFKKKAEIEAEKAEIAAKKEADKKADAAAGKKPEDKKVEGEPKVKDIVNDPIPETLKKETRERIQGLVSIVKESEGIIAHQQQLFDHIASTGMSPDEFSTTLAYARLIHSDKKEDWEQAYQIISGELRGLALRLGMPNAGFNVLAGHDDLIGQVNEGKLTREIAEEIAMNRARTQDATARQAAAARATQNTEQERATAIQSLTDIGNEYASIDPQYAAKAAILVPQLQAKLKTVSPSQWVATFKKAYAELRLPAASVAPVAPKTPVVKPMPLRANKQPSGGQNKQPNGMHDAIFGEGFANRFGR